MSPAISSVRPAAPTVKDKPAAALAARYREVRVATERLCEPLSAEDCALQSMADASPAKWHLAHTSWFFETFILARELADYRPFHPQFRVLFNSYYNTVGEQHPRPNRGLLTRPSLEQVLAYRKHVDDEVLGLIDKTDVSRLAELLQLGLHHEQQHQELILMDIKHLLSCNPLYPAYKPCNGRAVSLHPLYGPPSLEWHSYEEDARWLGHADDGFAFDNEHPRHRVFVTGYEFADRLITNGEYLAFIEDDGYQRPDLWLSDGWTVVNSRGWQAPLYWRKIDGAWWEMTLSGLHALDMAAPVCHVSYYEADAYASWRGVRLPSEAEWEHAASNVPVSGNFMEDNVLHPTPVKKDEYWNRPQQVFGDTWEWTQSHYGPYPGYRPAAGALGEYNGKFMCNQFVLRGGACSTPASHVRPTYRNFFYPDARWQFSGIRLARYS